MSKKLGRIFVSHATPDAELIKEFVRMLMTGLSITHEQIFCTSLEGMRIPQGKNFIEYLRKELTEADYVIMVVTPSYYEGPYCMCELGATWILATACSPLVVPPITHENLQGVLFGSQVGSIDDPKALNDLHDALVKAGICKAPPSGLWQSERDSFLKKLKKLLAELAAPKKVSAEDHKNLQEAYDACLEGKANLEKTIEDQDDRIEKIKKTKDVKEVNAILLEGKGEQEQFEAVTQAFKEATRDVPNIAVEVMFKCHTDGSFIGPPNYGNEHVWENIESAQERGLIVVDGNEITVNEDSPKMKRAGRALDAVANFLGKTSREFDEAYEEEHDHQCSLSIRDFWEEHLGLS